MPKGEEKNMHKGSYSVKSVFHEYMLVIFTHTHTHTEIQIETQKTCLCVYEKVDGKSSLDINVMEPV